MKLLNLGCGNVRPTGSWINMDTLYEQLTAHPHGGPALDNLKQEPNYIDHDMLNFPWPFMDGEFDGVLASHVFEHFECQDVLRIAQECARVLAPDGVLRVSVPNASYFRFVYPRDCRANWMELFGEGNDISHNETYMAVALFFAQHKQVYTKDALWCQLVQAGFNYNRVYETLPGQTVSESDAGVAMADLDNRNKFSVYMEARK